MVKSQQSGKVQAVLGTVDPSTLGMTSMHEHVFIDLVGMNTPGGESESRRLKVGDPARLRTIR